MSDVFIGDYDALITSGEHDEFPDDGEHIDIKQVEIWRALEKKVRELLEYGHLRGGYDELRSLTVKLDVLRCA